MKYLVILAALIATVRCCGYPGSPAHSTVTFSDESLGPGTVATYTCDRGFELLGPARRVCNENGTWSAPGIPFCVLNVAAGKAPMQSSVFQRNIPQMAVDGSTESCMQTNREAAPWWYVNLLEPYMVDLVRIDMGMDCCAHNEPATLVVRVGNNRPDLGVNPTCNRYRGRIEKGRPLFLPCSVPLPGAFVSIHLEGPPGNALSICEAFVYTNQALPIERCPQFRQQPPGSTATYNGKCYIFYNQEQMNFRDAKDFCESQGGSLVDETNPALQGFLSWEMWRRHGPDSNGQYWMGAYRDKRNPQMWRWINGKEVDISFWNLPGGNENCARFDGTKGWLWSDTNCNLNLNFICQYKPGTCGRPEQPPNSTMILPDLKVGSKVRYTCNKGHLIDGPVSRTCLPTGFYSDFPPLCQYIQCGVPVSPAHGWYEFTNGTSDYESQIRYHCQPGYTLIGQKTLICDVDGKWNGPPPKCGPVYCVDPPQIFHGTYTLSTNSTIFGTVVQYSCESRQYRLVGRSKLICQKDGTYDGEPPVCREEPRKTEVPSYRIPPPRPRPPHLEPLEPLDNVPSGPPPDVQSGGYPFPEENDIPDINKIQSGNSPQANLPNLEGKSEDNGPKLNTGGIIALGVFGGFVFLAAVITTIIILVRRNRSSRHYRQRGSLDASDGSSTGSRGMNKYYKRAWENLQDGGGGSGGLQRLGGGDKFHHEDSYRPRLGSEGMRDAGEMTVSDMYNNKREKKRHHHHHHRRTDSGGSLGHDDHRYKKGHSRKHNY